MEFITPNGAVIGLKEYITGKDLIEFKRLVFSKMKQGELDKKGAPTMNIEPSIAIDQEVKMIELTVLSVNGSLEKPSEAVQNLESKEYQAVANHVREVFFSKVIW